ncbi:MAG: hypothetical protein JRG79_07335 [Deltaproteobacteria bacterium]|nr:hypothetical protein [Deltaproteobacteria bacterium]MBW1944311.1 hypothetical protein [Deltaproteobacteria bacterium]MBW2206709.1 hypothetical protein [Deltaproteobacteria bacterium]
MPYVDKEARVRLDGGAAPQNAGELNYVITRCVDEYLIQKGSLRYANINEVIGVLECAKLELYRRIAVPYEDGKKEASGDVYKVATEIE